LRLNAKERKCTEFYDFIKLNKHPWLNTPVFRCIWCSSSYKWQKIFSTRAIHNDHPGVWYNGYQVVVTRTREGLFHMISKDIVRPLNEIEIIENPNITMSHNEKKQMLDRIQYLLNNEPENKEIKDGLNNPNVIEDIKWKIYQKTLSLKSSNHIDEALKLIKLIQIFLTQHLKW
jgi:hypothetical protein